MNGMLRWTKRRGGEELSAGESGWLFDSGGHGVFKGGGSVWLEHRWQEVALCAMRWDGQMRPGRALMVAGRHLVLS